MIGTGLKVPSILYMGWFGPRGLATIVYTALVVTSSELSAISTITAVAVVTVRVIVFAHGLTAFPGSQRNADWCESRDHDGFAEAKPVRRTLQSRLQRETD
jgi:NhaP-type Na+/H+ or K+/H+ antiporter